MDAGEVFCLDVRGRAKTEDGLEWVVYSDGRYTHVVNAVHWDRCGLEPSDDELIQRDRFDKWNNNDEMWAEDDVAIDVARRCGLVGVHSKNSCGWVSCEEQEAF